MSNCSEVLTGAFRQVREIRSGDVLGLRHERLDRLPTKAIRCTSACVRTRLSPSLYISFSLSLCACECFFIHVRRLSLSVRASVS
jgi:hypothetical protein